MAGGVKVSEFYFGVALVSQVLNWKEVVVVVVLEGGGTGTESREGKRVERDNV
ncbi:hypothetical protein Hanom_Chr13g01199691 [Helianthus anomalus]